MDIKKISLCSAGSLKSGRFVMKNQKEYLINYYKSLGYIVDFYFYTNNRRDKRCFNNGIINYKEELENEDRIYEYYNFMIKNVNKSQIIINKEFRDNNKLSTQQILIYYNSLKMIKDSGINYNIIVWFRPDGFFLNYPNSPRENEIINTNWKSTNNNTINTIQIFRGIYLDKILNILNIINKLYLDELNISIKTVTIYYETILCNIIKDSGLNVNSQDNLYLHWYGINTLYFKNIYWEYYNDWNNEFNGVGAYPYNFEHVKRVRDLHDCMKKNNKQLICSLLPNTSFIYFYDYCNKEESIEFKQLMLSAFSADKYICEKSDILYNFIIHELNTECIN
jgi:hypothetical protein